MAKFYVNAILDGIISGSAGVFGFSLAEKNWGGALLSGIIAVSGMVISFYIKFKK